MNGVVERQNRTLKEMIRSIISHSTLPDSHWGEVLKTTTYILNRVPTKATNNKTPYQLWTGKKVESKCAKKVFLDYRKSYIENELKRQEMQNFKPVNTL